MYIPPGFCFLSQESVKSLLLQGVGTDPSRLVRISIASLIAKLAKTLFATPQGWQEVGGWAAGGREIFVIAVLDSPV